MINIRKVGLEDKARLYEICLRTGESGKDATDLFERPELLGQIWVGPYLHLSKEHCFVLQDNNGFIIGYCIAAASTTSFEHESNLHWWPQIQPLYTNPDIVLREHWNRDEKLIHRIYNPTPSSLESLNKYPSHAHINLLPQIQGKGWGRKMMQVMENSLRGAGSHGIHLILSAVNEDALAFYKTVGYHVIFEDAEGIGVAKDL